MPNGYFNGAARASGMSGKAASAGMPCGEKRAPMKEKPGYSTGAPGKTQSKDRSGGVKRIKAYPSSDGI